jgi:hypothetical protein
LERIYETFRLVLTNRDGTTSAPDYYHLGL